MCCDVYLRITVAGEEGNFPHSGALHGDLLTKDHLKIYIPAYLRQLPGRAVQCSPV